MNIEYANTIPMRQILSKLGIQPVAKSDDELLYQSPFLQSHEPSFVIKAKTNTWADLTDNDSGDVVDFSIKYLRWYNLDYSHYAAIEWLKSIVGYAVLNSPKDVADYSIIDSRYSYTNHGHLSTPYLIHYLEQVRGIPFDIARFRIAEVEVHNAKTGKSFLSLGHKTEHGTFSIRNEHVKAQIKKAYVTFIRGNTYPAVRLHIFKDIFDYLSALTMRNGKEFADDVLILNTYTNVQLSAAFIYNYDYSTVYTWLDNTPVGIEATRNYRKYLKAHSVPVHMPMNKMYSKYKSLNDWLVAQRKDQQAV